MADRRANYGNSKRMFELMLRCYPFLQKEYDWCRGLGMSRKTARDYVLDVADYRIYEHEWLVLNNYGYVRGIIKRPKRQFALDSLVKQFENVPIMAEENIDFSEIDFEIKWMPDISEYRFETVNAPDHLTEGEKE